MGRITIFTANDLLSSQVKVAFESCGLPYTEIPFNHCPARYNKVRMISSCASAPQVFFNTRFVGGLDETIKELKKWGKKCGGSTKSMQKKYYEDVGKHPTFINEAFEPVLHQVASKNKVTPYIVSAAKLVELRDGTATTHHDIIEKLKNSLPFLEEYAHKGNVYTNCCFNSKAAAKEFQTSLCLSEVEAIEFGNLLMKQNIMYCMDGSTNAVFDVTKNSVCSLYCHKRLNVLNSYCKWSATARRPPNQIIEELDILLQDIESASTNEHGKLDHSAVRSNASYPLFEEAVCILQNVNVIGLDCDEMLAFALNLYNLMIRYAFIKVGVPKNDDARLKLLNSLQFNIGGHLFTFCDWINGVLRGNRKTTFNKKKPFDENDARTKLSPFRAAFDARIHFAINTGPCFGTRRTTPFERYTAEDIENQLDIVSTIYFEDEVNFRIDISSGQFYLTKSLAWFRSDFCNNDNEWITALEQYAQGTQLFDIRKLARQNSKLKVKYVDLDCTRNIVNYLEFDGSSSRKRKGIKELFFRCSTHRFQPPTMHPNEIARLTTLHNLNVLDSLPEERIDRLTHMVKEKFNVPIVLVSLVDENRQWFLSKQWCCKAPVANETSRHVSICGHTILGSEDKIFHIKDLTKDERFADNPLVTGGLGLRFYAGCPLAVPDTSSSASSTTYNIGTLCLADQQPRDFSEEEKALLRKYANEVRHEILNRPERNIASVFSPFVKAPVAA